MCKKLIESIYNKVNELFYLSIIYLYTHENKQNK